MLQPIALVSFCLVEFLKLLKWMEVWIFLIMIKGLLVFDKEEKELDDEIHKKYIFGGHVTAYMKTLIEDEPEKNKTHFSQYRENLMRKKHDQVDDDNYNQSKDDKPSDSGVSMHAYFLEFLRERSMSITSPLKDSISILCTHIARICIMEYNLKELACLICYLDSFQDLLLENNIVSEVLEEVFSPESQLSSSESVAGAEFSLHLTRTECLSLLRTIKVSLGNPIMPDVRTEESIREFCLQTSSLIFSIASSSFQRHSVSMEPLDILVIEETAQFRIKLGETENQKIIKSEYALTIFLIAGSSTSYI